MNDCLKHRTGGECRSHKDLSQNTGQFCILTGCDYRAATFVNTQNVHLKWVPVICGYDGNVIL